MENNNEILDERQQQLVKISAFTSKSDAKNLRFVLNETLDAGLTINEINETLAHLYAYVGFPASIRGIHLFKEVVEERKANGLKDETGRETTPVSDKLSRYERGEKAQMVVTAMSAEQLKTLFAFNPLIDVFLKEHLFADIFDRDILNYTDREIITVAALVSTVDSFTQSHINGALNVGVTEAQLRDLLQVIETNIGEREADAGRKVLDEVVASRAKY